MDAKPSAGTIAPRAPRRGDARAHLAQDARDSERSRSSRLPTRRMMAPAKDDETVPGSLLYRKETPLDGSAPLLLYGYGAYGMSIPAGFFDQRA